MSAAAKLVLTLFSAVFDVLTKYPQTDNILLPNFASLIRHCLTASCNAANPTGEPSQLASSGPRCRVSPSDNPARDGT